MTTEGLLENSATLISAALVGSALALDPICVNVGGPNFVINSGFSSGTARWNQIRTGAGANIQNGEQADDTYGPFWYASISGATIGTEYVLSINYQGFIPQT
ncbi:unnamed protein product [Clonostachys rhizophaga]|uniref:Uncharacterized protein n=1 Tax=Clonostachys rhizophaga TaxID=160324 RepID=A0A9N9W3X2_9HYPO|nr:unnamed protein product [Clonostachys rhizophaga]